LLKREETNQMKVDSVGGREKKRRERGREKTKKLGGGTPGGVKEMKSSKLKLGTLDFWKD